MTRKNKTGRLSSDLIYRLIKDISNKANKELEDREKIPGNPHMFRHTHAMNLIRKGRDVTYIARRLGHSSLQSVSKYTIPSEETEREYLKDVESETLYGEKK